LQTKLNQNVYEESVKRISLVFDIFPRIYVSFSGGKDSSVMLHLVVNEAIKRRRKIGVLFVDLEGQYKLTIDHIQTMLELYKDYIEPFWVSLPLNLRNAVSQFEPQWMCFDPNRKDDWIRIPPKIAITDESYFPFFKRRMEFEEFVPEFGKWYAQDKLCACFVGIRAQESLNRWRTIAGHGFKFKYENNYLNWTNYVIGTVYNIYPIYDWKTEDIWTYNGKFKKPYNTLYDLMYKAGLTIHQQRICQPYGDDQRKGLWLFHLIEPETWARVVARVNGANQGALYAQESGNILGRIKITKPENHTWESFAMMLLDSMPKTTAEHFKNKIAVFLHWWSIRGYPDRIPDETTQKEEANHEKPSWRRICKALLRNDYWCKGLSFSAGSGGLGSPKYVRMMAKRRQLWQIF
jgi:predicted phosphoadenosine phosphosulfate sulfurtransferase